MIRKLDPSWGCWAQCHKCQCWNYRNKMFCRSRKIALWRGKFLKAGFYYLKLFLLHRNYSLTAESRLKPSSQKQTGNSSTWRDSWTLDLVWAHMTSSRREMPFFKLPFLVSAAQGESKQCWALDVGFQRVRRRCKVHLWNHRTLQCDAPQISNHAQRFVSLSERNKKEDKCKSRRHVTATSLKRMNTRWRSLRRAERTRSHSHVNTSRHAHTQQHTLFVHLFQLVKSQDVEEEFSQDTKSGHNFTPFMGFS